MQCLLQDLSLARTHIISNFLATFFFSLSTLESACRHTLGAAGGWAPALLTVWRPHDFIFIAVRGGPHYVSTPGSMGSLFWLGSGAAQHGGCVSPTAPPWLCRVGEEWMEGSGAEI